MNYTPSKTIRAFMESSSRVRTLQGPVGGGSTTACLQEIMRQCKTMPYSQGKRRSRWLILSPNQGHLVDCMLRSFDEFLIDRNEGATSFSANDGLRVTTFATADVEAQIFFRTSKNSRAYNNLEFTGAFIVDYQEHTNPEGLESVFGRVGRYPRQHEVSDHFQYGVIIDSCFGGCDLGEVFTQPSAFSLNADNKENLPEGYYDLVATGRSDEWIKRHLTGGKNE